jgi:hypothetical protein
MHSNYRSNGGLDAKIFDHPRQRTTQEIWLQMASPAAKNDCFSPVVQGGRSKQRVHAANSPHRRRALHRQQRVASLNLFNNARRLRHQHRYAQPALV